MHASAESRGGGFGNFERRGGRGREPESAPGYDEAVPAVLAIAAAVAAASPAVHVAVSGFPIVCGEPRGSVTVVFPAPVRVAPSISPTTVRLNGTMPERIVVVGRKVTITPPRPAGVLCDSIALGPLTIRFSAGLRIGAARAAIVTHGAQRFTARLSG